LITSNLTAKLESEIVELDKEAKEAASKKEYEKAYHLSERKAELEKKAKEAALKKATELVKQRAELEKQAREAAEKKADGPVADAAAANQRAKGRAPVIFFSFSNGFFLLQTSSCFSPCRLLQN